MIQFFIVAAKQILKHEDACLAESIGESIAESIKLSAQDIQ